MAARSPSTAHCSTMFTKLSHRFPGLSLSSFIRLHFVEHSQYVLKSFWIPFASTFMSSNRAKNSLCVFWFLFAVHFQRLDPVLVGAGLTAHLHHPPTCIFPRSSSIPSVSPLCLFSSASYCWHSISYFSFSSGVWRGGSSSAFHPLRPAP